MENEYSKKEMKILEQKLQWVINHFKNGFLHGDNFKILWGARSIHKHDWPEIKKFLKKFDIKTVLEFGSGLSTELMLLEGIEVTCLENDLVWAKKARQSLGNQIIYYEDEIPELDRTFDLAFLDGPQQGPRQPELEYCKDHSDFIYLHDLDSTRLPTVQKLLKDWETFPNFSDHFRRKKS